jgi:hypothetical protein
MSRAITIATLVALLGTLGLAGCASSGLKVVLLDPVGPLSGMSFRQSKTAIPGQLQVYTLTTIFNDGGITYYPNTPYDVFDADGRFVVHVRNAVMKSDQVAEMVSLRSGLYFVRAQAPAVGVVQIPALIMPEQLTYINVQQSGRPRYLTDPISEWVTLRNGWPVGRKAKFETGAMPPQIASPPVLGDAPAQPAETKTNQ